MSKEESGSKEGKANGFRADVESRDVGQEPKLLYPGYRNSLGPKNSG